MINFLKGLPLNVLAVEATGQVTHEDYRDRLIPKAEAMLGHGPIRMLYVIGPEFTGFDIGAIVDDGIFGMRHSHDFVRIAVVTDLAWPKTAIAMFQPFLPPEFRAFSLAALDSAKDWSVEGLKTG
jgi:hypothetical protein